MSQETDFSALIKWPECNKYSVACVATYFKEVTPELNNEYSIVYKNKPYSVLVLFLGK